jgi:hypothetical protein
MESSSQPKSSYVGWALTLIAVVALIAVACADQRPPPSRALRGPSNPRQL